MKLSPSAGMTQPVPSDGAAARELCIPRMFSALHPELTVRHSPHICILAQSMEAPLGSALPQQGFGET